MANTFGFASPPAFFTSAQVAGHGTAPTSLSPEHTPNLEVDSIPVLNGDAISHVMTLYMYQAGTYYLLGSATIPANAGNGVVPLADALALALPSAVVPLQIPANWGVSWSIEANLTTGPMVVNLIGGYL